MAGPPSTKPPPAPPPWDFGRLIAQALCALFACIGTLPLLAGLLVRYPPLLERASTETARVLQEKLGVRATYQVHVGLLPLRLALTDVRVPANDGGPPVLTADRVTVAPGVFALLAGRLDAAEIEVDAPRVRVVVKDGKLQNLDYHLPERQRERPATGRPPFASLAVSDGRLEVDVDGVQVKAGTTDIDVLATQGPSFEVALRTSDATVRRRRPVLPPRVAGKPAPGPTREAVDEDVACRLDLRVRVEPDTVLVRRLSLLGFADHDPAEHSLPSCEHVVGTDDIDHVALRLSQIRLTRPSEGPPVVSGHVMARAPTHLVNRFVPMHPLRGWVGVVADVEYDGQRRLPKVHGKLRGEGLGFWRYNLARRIDADFDVVDDRVIVSQLLLGLADGIFEGKDLRIAPFEPQVPIQVAEVTSHDVEFSGMMRDLGVAQHTVVDWHLGKTRYSNIEGTLHPLDFAGAFHAQTGTFEVFDRGFDHPARHHMIGTGSSVIESRLAVKPGAVEFQNARTQFGNSSIHAPVISIGFHNTIRVEIAKADLDLTDITPITTIPWAGKAHLSMEMEGQSGNPLLTGKLAIDDFVFGGYPVGSLTRSQVRFRPLKVDFTDVAATKGDSTYTMPTARLDFDTRGAVIVDAHVKSPRAHLKDFYHIFHFDGDPRFEPLQGEGAVDVAVHYDIGGPLDRCGLGYLKVKGTAAIARADLYEELYDGGEATFDFEWFDQAANYLGANLDVPSFTLRKGAGVILGKLRMTPGARLEGNVVATGLPMSEIQSFGSLGKLVVARASAVADVGGSIDRLVFDSHVQVTEARIGAATLPMSSLRVRLEPPTSAVPRAGITKCGLPIPTEFDRALYDSDPSEGNYITDGELFGGQIRFEDFTTTRQRFKSVRGKIEAKALDLGALAQLSTTVAGLEPRPKGKLSGVLDIGEIKLVDPARGRARARLDELELSWNDSRVRLAPGADELVLGDGALDAHGLALGVSSGSGPEVVVDARARLTGLADAPQVEGRLDLRPLELSALASLLPNVDRARGKLRGGVSVHGSLSAPTYSGGLELTEGGLTVRGLPTPITDLGVKLALEQGELRIQHASARLGVGSVEVTGSAPLHGFELGNARAAIKVRSLALPVADGVQAAIDADLVANYAAAASPDQAVEPDQVVLPRVTGTVDLKSFRYSRPIVMSADIASLTQRGKRTSFEGYSAEDDVVAFDIRLRSDRAMEIENNLVEAKLELPQPGLRITGTNQRFGATGTIRMAKGGLIRLRQHEFVIDRGFVRFHDQSEVAPEVDVTATTEYRRYSQSTGSQGGGSSRGTTAQAAAGGRWLITLHAYGDAEELKVDLTSQPALAQDDIFLLLTVGLTRAELDQAKSASVGGSVALEALGTLTGADRAVTEAVPLIDEFRFGSAYSSRTGRTEPTVTIGKRLADRIRANVTSGISESREVRSNVEVELSPGLSVEGSYDNVNDISSSSLGNLGADIRWRLDFE